MWSVPCRGMEPYRDTHTASQTTKNELKRIQEYILKKYTTVLKKAPLEEQLITALYSSIENASLLSSLFITQSLNVERVFGARQHVFTLFTGSAMTQSTLSTLICF